MNFNSIKEVKRVDFRRSLWLKVRVPPLERLLRGQVLLEHWSSAQSPRLRISISPKSDDCPQTSCLRRINSSNARNVQTTSPRLIASSNNSEKRTAVPFSMTRTIISIFANGPFVLVDFARVVALRNA